MNSPRDEIHVPSANQRKHESRNPLQRALIRRFHDQAAAMVHRASPHSILELGCGEGYVLEALLDRGVAAEFHGVELSEPAVRLAQRRLGSRASIEHRDARELVVEHRDFDMVMMLEVLEHIPGPKQMLDILERLSRQWLLLSVPREPYFCALNFLRGKNLRRWGNDPEHVNHWTGRGFEKFVRARFDIVATPGVFPWTMVLARRRLTRAGDGAPFVDAVGSLTPDANARAPAPSRM